MDHAHVCTHSTVAHTQAAVLLLGFQRQACAAPRDRRVQPPITAKCQRGPLLPVRDELLLGRYFILNTSCLNWSMRLQEVTFLPICLLPPLPRGTALLLLSFHGGGTRGSLSPYSFSSSLLSLGAEQLAKEQSPGSCPSPLCSLQVKMYPRAQES